MSETAEPDVNPEFAAFEKEFYDHTLPEDMPEDEKQMWRDLR